MRRHRSQASYERSQEQTSSNQGSQLIKLIMPKTLLLIFLVKVPTGDTMIFVPIVENNERNQKSQCNCYQVGPITRLWNSIVSLWHCPYLEDVMFLIRVLYLKKALIITVWTTTTTFMKLKLLSSRKLVQYSHLFKIIVVIGLRDESKSNTMVGRFLLQIQKGFEKHTMWKGNYYSIEWKIFCIIILSPIYTLQSL